MSSRYLVLRWLFGALVALSVLFVLPSVSAAQEGEAESSASDDDEDGDEDATAERASTPAPARSGSGAPWESWLAMGVALGLGAAVIAVGGILGRLALDENAIALDAHTTQLAAQQTHRLATDYALASTVLLSIGAVMVGIGAVWAIVLPFSTPPGTAVTARITPTGVAIEGTF